MTDPNEESAEPLILSTDPAFMDQARRWCVAVGRAPEFQSRPEHVRRGWREASTVLVDVEFAHHLEALDLPRRDHVFLIAHDPERHWSTAVSVGAEKLFAIDAEHQIVAGLAAVFDGGGEACVISVVGACGGVGSSTVATAVAYRAAQRGLRSALVDGDETSGGIELILGAERTEGLRWPDLATVHGHVSVAELCSVLPRRHGVDVISFDRHRPGVSDVAPVMGAVMRGFDAVIADVPRYPNAVGDELLSRSVVTVLVVPRRLGGIVAAERLLPRLEEVAGNVVVVTRASVHGLDRHRVAERLRRPVLSDIPHSPRLAQDVEHGLGPRRGRVVRSADSILDAVGLR